MTLKLVCFSILATAAFGQSTPVAAKAAPETKIAAPATPPVLPSTSRLWRLVAKAQDLRRQLDETPQAKAVRDAEAEVQAEQSKLAQVCGAAFQLSIQQDPKAENNGDVICTPRPKETAAVPPVDPKKEK